MNLLFCFMKTDSCPPTRPECSGNYTAHDKMLFTLVAPLVLLAIVLAFAIVRTAINANLARRHHPPDSEVSWHEEFVAREHQAAKKATATATSVFVMASIFFFRSCLKPFKCEDDGSGAQYMVSNPEVECGDNDEHNELRRLGHLGIGLYLLVYFALTACLLWATKLCKDGHFDRLGKLGYLSFLSDKYEPQYFFWESVILARKIALMVAFFLFEGQESWLLATAIVGIALLAHAAARPFEAPLTDVTELFSLVANLVLLVSVPVYSVLQADSTAPGRVGGVTRFLEWLALLLIVAVCAVSMCKCSNARLTCAASLLTPPRHIDTDAQLHIFKVVAADDDDAKGDPDDGADLGGRSERVDESHSSYKQRMLRQRIEQILAEAEVAKQQLASYRAYQQRELDEVRQATAELNRLQLPE